MSQNKTRTNQDEAVIPAARRAPSDENDRPTIAIPAPTSGRGHQRSRTTIDLPPLFSRTPSSSPTRSSTFFPFLRTSSRSVSPERISLNEAAKFDLDAASSRDSAHQLKPSGAVERLASWFEGSSDPVNITLVPSPRKEKLDPLQEAENMEQVFGTSDSVDTFTRRPPKRLSISTSADQPRFNFFRKNPQAQQGPSSIDHDELVHLDVRDTLFPAGPANEYSPAAFKNLQLNAEGTLRRFQDAYIEQLKAIRSVTSAKNIQSDELEAAQTRNEHLKLQLADMAEKAAEQERLIAALRMEFSANNPFPNSGDMQQRSIRMVSQGTLPQVSQPVSRTRPGNRRYRSSDVSTSGESENGSDVSSVISIFSEAMPAPDSSVPSVAASPVMKHSSLQYTVVQDQSPLSRLAAAMPVLECKNCHGVRSTEAWDVITMMKAESLALKGRIAELEGANDDALDFLSGLKIV